MKLFKWLFVYLMLEASLLATFGQNDKIEDGEPQELHSSLRKFFEFVDSSRLDEAEKIFKATGYSDGLSRIGDRYLSNNEFLKALKLFLLAHNKRKSEPLIEKIAKTIEFLIKEDNLK